MRNAAESLNKVRGRKVDEFQDNVSDDYSITRFDGLDVLTDQGTPLMLPEVIPASLLHLCLPYTFGP